MREGSMSPKALRDSFVEAGQGEGGTSKQLGFTRREKVTELDKAAALRGFCQNTAKGRGVTNHKAPRGVELTSSSFPGRESTTTLPASPTLGAPEASQQPPTCPVAIEASRKGPGNFKNISSLLVGSWGRGLLEHLGVWAARETRKVSLLSCPISARILRALRDRQGR